MKREAGGAGGVAGRLGRDRARRGRRPRPPGTGWRGGRCRSRGARSSSTGWRGRCGCGATAGACPTSRPTPTHDLCFAQGFCHGQDRLWQMDFYRRVVARPGLRDGRAGGAAGRPADADARHPPRRRARGGGARPRAARPARALLRGRQRRRRERHGAALRDAAAAPRVRALAAGRHPQPRQAARLRPLDQLGAGAAARRHGCARSAPSWPPASTPTYPADNPVVTQEAVVRATGSRSSSRSTPCGARSASPPRPAAPTTGRSPARSAPPARR